MFEIKNSLLILLLVLVVLTSMGCASTSNSDAESTKHAQPTSSKNSAIEGTNKNTISTDKKSAPVFDQTAIDQLAPGWELKKSQMIEFPKQDVIVAGISNRAKNLRAK